MPNKKQDKPNRSRRKVEYLQQKEYCYYINGVVDRINALNKLNNDIQYHAAWSNECIEFWFVLHFAYYTSNNHRDRYVKFLNKEFKQRNIGKYTKNMLNIYDILMMYGNPKRAISYSKKILSDNKGKSPSKIAPATTVHELVIELAKYLPEEDRKCFV